MAKVNLTKKDKSPTESLDWRKGDYGVLLYADFDLVFYKYNKKSHEKYGDLWHDIEKISCYIEKSKKGNYLCIYTIKNKILVLKIKIEKPLDYLKEAKASILKPLFITEKDLKRQEMEKRLFNEFFNLDNNFKLYIKEEYKPLVLMVLESINTINGAVVQATEALANNGYTKVENIEKAKSIKNDVSINTNNVINNNSIDINSISHRLIKGSLGNLPFV